ncbi:MAG: hypothetical protein AAF296_03735 [Pseudomonadota bacterium]
MSPLIIGIIVAVVIGIGISTWKAPRLTSVLFWAALATILIGSALIMNLPGVVSQNLLWLLIAFPFIWVGLQFWCYWDPSKWRVAGGMVTLCMLLSVIVFVSTPLG